MTMGGRDQETVMLLPHRMNMRLSPSNDPKEDPVDLPLFFIINWNLVQRNNDCPEEGIRMIVVLRRKPVRELMVTYLPTVLLILTTYVTTFFGPEFFEAALGANLTTMLMMTTIFMTTLSDLTDTAYAKWIDYWLIFCQLVPFLEVILLTLKESYRDEDGSINRRNDNVQPWVSPHPDKIDSLEKMQKKPNYGLSRVKFLGRFNYLCKKSNLICLQRGMDSLLLLFCLRLSTSVLHLTTTTGFLNLLPTCVQGRSGNRTLIFPCNI